MVRRGHGLGTGEDKDAEQRFESLPLSPLLRKGEAWLRVAQLQGEAVQKELWGKLRGYEQIVQAALQSLGSSNSEEDGTQAVFVVLLVKAVRALLSSQQRLCHRTRCSLQLR